MERQDCRVNCCVEEQINFTFFMSDPNNKVYKAVTVTILDISATGMKFLSSQHLILNECFFIKLVNEDDIIELCCMIIRKAGDDNNNVYAAKFMNMDSLVEARLRSLIFKLQLERKGRIMGN